MSQNARRANAAAAAAQRERSECFAPSSPNLSIRQTGSLCGQRSTEYIQKPNIKLFGEERESATFSNFDDI
jgi:hypothetical protein